MVDLRLRCGGHGLGIPRTAGQYGSLTPGDRSDSVADALSRAAVTATTVVPPGHGNARLTTQGLSVVGEQTVLRDRTVVDLLAPA